eukprot:maker-scaffold456_size166325-snap-gene-0.23 protein:Tk11175 transcript:maker-scaffold456_size166325-snap-gene-0.23-mRNA-1 annotation:"hypothetical protein L798_10359"
MGEKPKRPRAFQGTEESSHLLRRIFKLRDLTVYKASRCPVKIHLREENRSKIMMKQILVVLLICALGHRVRANPAPQNFFFPESDEATTENAPAVEEAEDSQTASSSLVFEGDDSESTEDVDEADETQASLTNNAFDGAQTEITPKLGEEDYTDVEETNGDSEYDEATTVTAAEEDKSCSSVELSWINPNTGEEECHALTSQGPCAETEWFVMVKDSTEEPQGFCVERPCPKDQVLYQENCEEITSLLDCPFGMELLSNPFGEGECDCFEGLIAVYNETIEEFACYPEYSLEPCTEPNQQLQKVEGLNEFQCQDVPCEEGERLFDELCLADIDCTSEAPGDEELIETFCNFGIRQLLTLPEKCEDGKMRDYQGNCKEEFNFGGGATRPRRLANRRFRRGAFSSRFS